MKRIIILFWIITSTHVFGQTSKKDVGQFYSAITKLDTAEIRQGRHLELARVYSIEHFVSYYIENGKFQDTKKYGPQEISALYSDSVFTYFGRKYHYGLLDFFKVNLNELNKLNLENLDGIEIKKEFIDQIVPERDKQRVAKREKGCTSIFDNPQFTYTYKKESKEILITYKWKVTCDFFRIINKTYVAKYDIASKTFKK